MQPRFLRNLGLLYRVRGISHAIVTTTRSAPSVTGAQQFHVFFSPFTRPSRHGLWISHFQNESWASEQTNRMASITRWWQGSEPRGDQDTSSAYSPAAHRCKCAWELHRFAAWHSGEETIVTNNSPCLGPSSNPDLCEAIKHISSFIMFYPQFTQEPFEAQRWCQRTPGQLYWCVPRFQPFHSLHRSLQGCLFEVPRTQKSSSVRRNGFCPSGWGAAVSCLSQV